MSVSPLDDVVSSALDVALDAVSERQRVIAQNISNSATPNYRASKVDFESSLAAAAAAGDPSQTVVSTTKTSDAAKADGNNVDLTKEFNNLNQSKLLYEALTAARNFKLNAISKAL
jgi:flagellar basal-body rod protein FlgB